MAGPCFSKHGPVFITVLKNFFRLDVMQPFKNHSSSWLGRAPQQPLSRPSWFCGVEESFRFDVMQIVNNVHMNSSSCSPKHDPVHFTVSKLFSRHVVMKLLRNIRFDGWAVLPETRPSSFHDVENLFRLDVMHTFKTIQVYGCAALPNIPCHGPADFAGLKNLFVLFLCRLSTTFKSTARRAPPNTIQLISRC